MLGSLGFGNHKVVPRAERKRIVALSQKTEVRCGECESSRPNLLLVGRAFMRSDLLLA